MKNTSIKLKKNDANSSPNLTSLFESWSNEFSSQINRVFALIGGRHHYELGSHREILFRNFLRNYLPNHWEVSTGFIIGNGKVSKQQDVIIWDSSSHMPFLREGEFVIVPKESVMAMIEVKTTIDRKEIKNAFKCLHSEMFHNWRLGKQNPWTLKEETITNHVPFRGIFAISSMKKNTVEMIYDELLQFYSDYYPAQSRSDIICEHTSDLRYVHLIDSICILDNLSIRQSCLNGEFNNAKVSEPCFIAWKYECDKSKALAWFLFKGHRERVWVKNPIILM